MATGQSRRWWGWLTLVGVEMFAIKKQVEETPSTKTVIFEGKLAASPGQFVMVWVPGVDEFPMSVAYTGSRFGITYQIVGEGTKALAAKKPGERIGIRGPYGRGFELRGKRLLVVAGGAGMAPIAPFIDDALEKKARVDLVLGARTKTELLFERRAGRAGAAVHVSTDDGSKGFKGFASELADEIVKKGKFDSIYTCGPERMIVKMLKISKRSGIPIQASLERIMKCGIGVCDSCAIDGLHVCTDGPVFSDEQLKKLDELGKTKLDLAGRKISV